MGLSKIINRKYLNTASNVLFAGIMALLIFSPDAKSWVLKQLVTVGLFSAEIEEKTSNAPTAADTVSFNYQDEKGNPASTGQLKGKVVFVNFWATWCPPCRAEMPSLNELYIKFRNDERIVFLFVNEDDDPAKATAYLQKNGYDMPMVVSKEHIDPAIYSGTLPTTVILDKEGKIVFKHEGMASYNTDKFIDQLKSLM